MHRLLVPADSLTSARPTLPREAERHVRALRLEEGEALELFDGAGRTRECVCRAGAVEPVGAVRVHSRPAAEITLYACVTKGARWDWTVEKCTELGVTRVVPVISDRTIVRLARDERAAKAGRWRRVAADAARQSDAVWLPRVDEAVDFDEALAMVRAGEGGACFVGALADPPPPPMLSAVRAAASADGPARLAAFIGPEGDFTPSELAALCAVATPVSLGPTVLRAETAAVFAVSVLAAAAADFSVSQSRMKGVGK